MANTTDINSTSTILPDTNTTTTSTTITTTEQLNAKTTYTTTTFRITTEDTNPDDNGNEMGSGDIAGIVIGCLIVVFGVLVVVIFLWRRKKKEKRKKQLLQDHPLPDVNQLRQLDEEKMKESKKQKQKHKSHKKKKHPTIEQEAPSNVSVSSVGYVNVSKEKKESPYANTTKDGAPAVPIEEEPSSDYVEPVKTTVTYSGAGGIDYYITKNDGKKEGNYDVPAQQGKGTKNDNVVSNNLPSQSGKDYVNVPQKLAPGQAPKPGKSIRREASTDSEQLVYENVENEDKTTNDQNKH